MLMKNKGTCLTSNSRLIRRGARLIREQNEAYLLDEQREFAREADAVVLRHASDRRDESVQRGLVDRPGGRGRLVDSLDRIKNLLQARASEPMLRGRGW